MKPSFHSNGLQEVGFDFFSEHVHGKAMDIHVEIIRIDNTEGM